MSEVNWEQIEEAFEECEKNGGIELCLTGVDCVADDDRPEVLDEVLNLSFERFPDLEKLSLVVGGDGLTLSMLEQHVDAQPTLRSLGLIVVCDTALRALARRDRLLTKIDYLSLEGVGDEGLISVVAQAQHLTALQHLEFEVCSFGDDGLRALADQAELLVSLERLSDCDPPFDDDRPAPKKGYAALMKGLASGRQKLDLSWWYSDDAGLKAFAQKGQALTSLRELSLSGRDITDDGLCALLRQSRYLGNLERLILRETAVSDVLLSTIAERASHLSNLRTLDL